METTLYDRDGYPIAYIASDYDNAIYLWNGNAVCYLYNNEKVYGWRGKHIGWFVDGVVYDEYGHRVGFIKEKCPCITKISPVKHVKHVRHVKSVKQVSRVRPILSLSISNWNLEQFLEQNKS